MEPPIVDREVVTYRERRKPWQEQPMAMVEDRRSVHRREHPNLSGYARYLHRSQPNSRTDPAAMSSVE